MGKNQIAADTILADFVSYFLVSYHDQSLKVLNSAILVMSIDQKTSILTFTNVCYFFVINAFINVYFFLAFITSLV